MKKLTIVIALVASFHATGWAAARYSGNDLLTDLKDSQGTGMLSGLSYLGGIIDAEALARNLEQRRPYPRPYYCLPDGVTGGQVSDIVRQHLEANPTTRHYSAVFPVTAALLKAFPCKENPR